jgi:hypothetical protein
MKDPYVAEVRKYRMLHTKRFDSYLHLICEDLRNFERSLGHRVVTLDPRKILRTRKPRLPRVPLGV